MNLKYHQLLFPKDLFSRKMFRTIIILIFLSSSIYGQPSQVQFNEMVNDLLSHSVKEVYPNDINEKDNILFLDAREKEEFEVSHLENARWIGYNNFRRNSLEGIPKDKKIVVYCSVGYRSEKIAERLLQMGFSDVTNLYGGIFKWVNEGKNVVSENNSPTNKVHAYNEEWGKWLIKGEKVY